MNEPPNPQSAKSKATPPALIDACWYYGWRGNEYWLLKKLRWI